MTEITWRFDVNVFEPFSKTSVFGDRKRRFSVDGFKFIQVSVDRALKSQFKNRLKFSVQSQGVMKLATFLLRAIPCIESVQYGYYM